MNTTFTKYCNKYGNFSHILNIELDGSLNESERMDILADIYRMINEKKIEKHISNADIPLTWRVYDETDLLHYYTDAVYLEDKGVYKHTKLLLNDLKLINNGDKFTIYLTKPLTGKICMM